MRQLIIARKDLEMSAGKLAAQCCHASEAFLTSHLRDRENVTEVTDEAGQICYRAEYTFSKEVYEDWICGIFTKTVCEAKNRTHLLKAKTMAEEMGLEEGKDFFLIWDRCLTELEPEEVDDAGIGWTLTAIGFKPLDDETAHKISTKYQLYK